METTAKQTFVKTLKYQVVATWGWNLIGTFLITVIAALFLPANFNTDRQAMLADPWLALIPIMAELVAVGMLPVLFTLFQRENPTQYGLQKKGLWKGLLLSALVVAFFFVFVYLGIERFNPMQMAELQIRSIWHVPGAVLAAFAFGPLEVFFVIWLIHNTDRILHGENKILSRGLVVTILIYALLHTFSQGFYAFFIAARYFAFGWIYKATHNAIGPMLAGTVTNEFVWFLGNVFLLSV